MSMTWKMWGRVRSDLCPTQGGGFFVGGDDKKEDRMSLESLKCKECGTAYELDARYVCENCFGPLEVAYDHSGLDAREAKRRIQAGSQGIWRYADFLPFEGRPGDPLEPGLTPLLRADRLAERLGLDAELWIKNDAANPTHSFKDRVVAVAVAKAQELGLDTVACASTGNLANAVAAHAAAAGLASYVFVPANLEEQKLLATGVYGTNLVGVRGNYDDVNRLCTQLAENRPWAFVNVNLRPYYAEGSKTLAYETVEQFGWELPDRVVCPIASGSLFTKVGRGFQEWLDLGLVSGGQPVFNGAQAEGCSPVATAFAEGWEVCKPQKPETIAKSLAIGDPADGPYALEHARKTGGGVDSVTDEEIRDGIRLLAETTGIFTETAGGVTVGVLRKLAERGEIAAGERVVVYITGEGLKTLDATRDRFQMHEIDPDLESFESEFRQEVSV
jgi:threonine synthase